MFGGRRTACENGSVGKALRRLLGIGLLVGVVYALWRKLPTRPETAGASGSHWEPQPFPFPPRPVIDLDRASDSGASTDSPTGAPTDSPTDAPTDESPWVEPADSGACPAHHPVKAKLASGIFHVPGGANYARTKADRCYLSTDAAEADGLRQSKN